ncbi:hypothetical protein CF326_g2961 [Tilletia indica]|nr:hypothetical protein CF326_g2961 [Tilletia indica]
MAPAPAHPSARPHQTPSPTPSSSASAPLALTLTWQASTAIPNPRRQRRLRAQRKSHPLSSTLADVVLPPSISYNGIPTSDCLDPEQAELDADPWGGSTLDPSSSSAADSPIITALLPLSMERIVLALSDGSLAVRSLAQLSTTASLASLPPALESATLLSCPPTQLRGHITTLQQIQIPTSSSSRSRPGASASSAAANTLKLVVGTTEQGELLIWDAATLTLFAELPLFSGPIESVVLLDLDSPSSSIPAPRSSHSRLNGCLACAATDGTLAILHLDVSARPSEGSGGGASSSTPTAKGAGMGYDVHVSLQHTIPSRGPDAPLQTLFLRNAELLLLYADGRARLWDTAVSFPLSLDPSSSSLGAGLGGAELRRSIGADQAMSLVEDDNKAYDALYAGSNVTPQIRPTSLYTSSQTHSPVIGSNTSHLAPPTDRHSASGFATPDPASSTGGRPRFAAASHAAHALLLGLNGGHFPGVGGGSRTASGTASPNPGGPVVPTQRWVSFDFTSSSTTTAAAAGVLSLLQEDEEDGESESFTLRADLRRAIEAAAKALIPKGGAAPSQASSQQHGKVGLTSPAAIKAFGIVRPILVGLIASERREGEGKEVGEAWRVLGERVGLDIGSVRAAGKGRPRLGLVIPQRGLCLERDDRRPPTSHSEVLTTYIVALGSILRILSRISGLHDVVDTLRHEYIDSRAQFPTPEDEAPISLDVLSLYFLDSSHDIRETAKHLLHAAFRNLPQPDIDDLCRRWESSLPSRQPTASSDVPESQQHQSIMLLGLLGSQRYKLLPLTTLKDVASSITKYLHEPTSAHELTLALELILRGFATWQHYFDAMEVMRTLFWLSTNADQPTSAWRGTAGPHPHPQNGDTPQNGHSPSLTGGDGSTFGGAGGAGGGVLAHVPADVRALARRATLHIAGENTPLFMTTLSHDILHARSAAHCSATMRLVTFLVRQEPLILLANLPRLAEAVVKSLDPTVTAMREAVMQAATVMISDLVHTYPSIDFHGKAQRLAVGTHEGACILYDVKTATRLYVLEGHTAPCDACAFSPDGRRLVTVSHSEGSGGGRALVWKVGASFTSVLMPGQMPRQGGSDRSGAYKAVDFVMSEGAMAQIAKDPLGTIRFEWGGEGGGDSAGGGNNGSVRVMLGEVSLSFSVA